MENEAHGLLSMPGVGFFGMLVIAGAVEKVQQGTANHQVGVEGNAHQQEPLSPGKIAK